LRIAIAHPYVTEVGAKLEQYIVAAGFQVVSNTGLGLQPGAVDRVRPQQVRDIVYRTNRPDADLIFISCTALPTYDVIAPLEHELIKPIVTANQATIWSLLRAVDISAVGCGQTLLQY